MVIAFESNVALEKHFQNWLDLTVCESDREQVKIEIVRLLKEYPELLLTHSWPEIRKLSEVSFDVVRKKIK